MLVFTFTTTSEMIDINLNSLENSYLLIEQMNESKIKDLESDGNIDGLDEYKRYLEQIKKSLTIPKIKKPCKKY